MKKALKIAAGALAFLLIAGLLALANAFVGNPVSRVLAKRAAGTYLLETYPGMGLELEGVSYSFKTGGYLAQASLPGSLDTHFTLDISMTGRVLYDRYESHVASGFNTWQRLDAAYREKADGVLDALSYACLYAYGTLEQRADREAEAFGPVYGLPALEPEGEYDPLELGKTAGHLVLSLEEEPSAGRAAELLRELLAAFSEAGIPFYAVDLTLTEGESGFSVRNFLRQDIEGAGLAERLAASAAALEEFYRAADKENEIRP